MMTTTLKALMIAAAMTMALSGNAHADRHGDDAKMIEQAVLDYVSSIYDMKPELLDGSVSTKVQKVGYMPAQDGSGLQESWMTHAELKEIAGHLNKDGMFDPATAPREVTILDHTDMIANVKLVAGWGIDYIQLTKYSGQWMIINVLWEMGAH